MLYFFDTNIGFTTVSAPQLPNKGWGYWEMYSPLCSCNLYFPDILASDDIGIQRSAVTKFHSHNLDSSKLKKHLGKHVNKAHLKMSRKNNQFQWKV